MGILDRLIVAGMGLVPKPIVGKVARRYVAGESLDEGIVAVRKLEDQACSATFDLLGEFISDIAEGVKTADTYLEILDRIRAEGVSANISVKLTAFGLLIDREATYENIRRVVAHAATLGTFVRLDMEDSPCHDATFEIHRRLRGEGFENVGLVLQACMRRGAQDIRGQQDLRPGYRLCKGIYVEPEEIAFRDFEEVRENFLALLVQMIDAGSHVGIATHDPYLAEEACRIVTDRSLAKHQYEFQMLLGVAPQLRRGLLADGHPVRVYVPYGEQWYAYCVRRLKENPTIGRHILKALFRRG